MIRLCDVGSVKAAAMVHIMWCDSRRPAVNGSTLQPAGDRTVQGSGAAVTDVELPAETILHYSDRRCIFIKANSFWFG